MRNTKLVINTTCSHVLVPNANRTIFILDTVVFSIRIIGILRMFMSVELVNVIVACEENDCYLKEKKNKRFKKNLAKSTKNGHHGQTNAQRTANVNVITSFRHRFDPFNDRR